MSRGRHDASDVGNSEDDRIHPAHSLRHRHLLAEIQNPAPKVGGAIGQPMTGQAASVFDSEEPRKALAKCP